MLVLEGISAAYGPIRAVRDVTLRVPEGKIVALIGANGAGKTTTMRTIAGLLRPVAGRIVFRGERIDGLKPYRIARLGISLVPEGRQILARMTVRENLEMGAFFRRDRAEVEADFERVYALFPVLKERERQLGGTLSGGQQQMLAIARALMARPKLLLLDEPSMGLAPLVVRDIFRTIQAINAAGTTILIVEQNVRQVLAFADYVYVLEHGEIVREGPAEVLRSDPAIAAAYLGGRVSGTRRPDRRPQYL
ncbi:MAG: ABC transporter ATP-binding protein [Hydrogenibacillus schlegelii]|nr:ABC transporter ATP-binding protein [Hydrogenibacillus schlegelii]